MAGYAWRLFIHIVLYKPVDNSVNKFNGNITAPDRVKIARNPALKPTE